ncbi:IS30 family transposase [Secundilactobacillus folii]|uniref:IS30 family transposase n=1 Tax=Secundilactobacillus folii TaxID=2678357 RepID=A0A7X3C2F0_9LACO|nr:IS30 family transposase [Secundilactobacillus folii]MTV81496.1 IS30 family transposase [Secundilactobacillus folii]
MTQTQISMTHHYKQLSFKERGQIEAWRTPQLQPDGTLTQPLSISQIARMLGRHKATISREIKRGTTTQIKANHRFTTTYLADTGQAIYEDHRQHCHPAFKRELCSDFYAQLTIELKRRPRVHSVDTFVYFYRHTYPERPCPSTTTVYRDINAGVLSLRNSDLPVKLRRRVKGTGQSHSRKNQHVLGDSIETRPAVVDQRTEIGHWEGDLVKGKKTEDQPALMTLTERVTRFQIIFRISNYHATTCREGLETILADYGKEHFKSITFDNGSEFAELATIQDTQIYFAHPYSPWERGTNENHNGLIREFIPKGHSLYNYDITTIQAVQDALNARPRRLLGYHSPGDLMPGL